MQSSDLSTSGRTGRFPAHGRGSWRARRRVSPGWAIAVGIIAGLVALPVAAITVLALSAGFETWPHLLRTILPGALATTLMVMAGVATITLVVGAGTAWIITMYRFPGRGLLDRLLVIPLAVPTYIAAYCYVDLLGYAGPVQGALRAFFEWRTPRDYWFPDIRSTTGAIFLLASVLYPYVYLAARASFVQQSICVLEVARTLGRTPWGTFISVALPLARPALAAGVALVLMECLNDLGAVQHLGVETLSAALYATWLQRSSLGGAAQIALAALAVVLILFAIERHARGRKQFHHTTGRYRSIPFSELSGWWAVGAIIACLIPVVVGFVLPCLVLAYNALHFTDDAGWTALWRAAGNSMLLAVLAAAATVVLAVILAYARRIVGGPFMRFAVRLAGVGYALPGTVLALGLLIPLASLDNRIDALSRALFGLPLGLLMTGTLFALVLAFAIRFLAVSLGAIEAGMERVSPNLDAAARTLGSTPFATMVHVHLPLLLPALGSAGLLVFVDAMKELPAALLLRPFNFETLATHVYSLASLELFESAGLSSLLIVLVGLLPVLALHQAIASGRSGSSS
ncbi:iron ABC transporter permease [Hyphomicrobium sp. CS1BSMeth3]|uniref:ABC transporter permease n=1 Tax=Hyphomicrobium sp. CS1BSMeth3 TaxID=1892844 RepID=UPI0009FA4694|nr:iron ABC transporter permease [Hyphomicrobium sp. CS1BSMeth3]